MPPHGSVFQHQIQNVHVRLPKTPDLKIKVVGFSDYFPCSKCFLLLIGFQGQYSQAFWEEEEERCYGVYRFQDLQILELFAFQTQSHLEIQWSWNVILF